jgi:hypothetical protein
MNSTISTTQINTWKRIKAQYIVGAAGIALAVTAIAGAVSLDSNSPASPATRSVSISQSGPAAYPLVQEMSHPQASQSANATTFELAPNGGALVQELSVPQSAGALEVTAVNSSPEYLLVQEMSHQFAPVAIAEATTGIAPNGNALVQELSHPRSAGTLEVTAVNSSPEYLLVQEMSHQFAPVAIAEATTGIAPNGNALVQELSHPR